MIFNLKNPVINKGFAQRLTSAYTIPDLPSQPKAQSIKKQQSFGDISQPKPQIKRQKSFGDINKGK